MRIKSNAETSSFLKFKNLEFDKKKLILFVYAQCVIVYF